MKRTISELIIGFLKGSLDKEEKDDFYNWVNQNPKNKKIYFEAKNIYDVCLFENKTINIEESWLRLLKKRHKQASIKTYNLWQRISSYSAVAVVAIILTSAFFIIQNNEQSSMTAQYIGGNGLEADKIILPDGTLVNIGSRSKFHYSPDYGKKRRIVYLEGEASFDVAKQKSRPFIVKINGQEVEALGTKFNVMAYPNDSVIATTLLEGSVRLTSENMSKPVILAPNQQFVYNKKAKVARINQVDASLYTSWVDGYYYFPDQKLSAILDRLSHLYGITFNIQSAKLQNEKFTGTFYRGQTIKDILEIIKLSIPIEYQIDEQRVTIN